MKVFSKINRAYYFAFLMLSIFAVGCKKDKKVTPDTEVPTTGTRDELTKDSIYLYAKQTYFWNNSLPDYATFNPRKFSSFDAELFALTQYSLNPATGKPYEYTGTAGEPKYSFIDDGSVSTQLGGTAGDYGFSVFYNSPSDLRIKYVYGGSPAASAGLKRGYQITKLNGKTGLTTSDADINYVVNAIFGDAASVSMTVKKPDGTQQDVVVAKATYALNPIILSKVFTVGAKKVAYIVFNSFTTNSSPALKQVFSDFSAQGATEVIVDLRYNGGGSVGTAGDLVNLIAPATQNGKVMYTTVFNQTMQSGQATILKNQKFYQGSTMYSYYDFDYKPTTAAGNVELFSKIGAASINRAYFIVTGSTASASELTINSLKPIMDVKLIGKKTYGKPVGFFAIHIDKYDMYIPQFETQNQLGVGAYYDGLSVDKEDNDDVTKDFGDPTEKLLSYALGYSANGMFATSNPKNGTIAGAPAFTSSEIEHITSELDRKQFKGMIKQESKSNK
ncbi:MAG: hypothetical protein K0S09_155 [Sphingobacteriaceae bacterium]|jgi:hypothetical protein|nr:hypothetical protein [Sphingobacteriaceae bacterium]